MNTGHFAGHLGRDAELRTTPGGHSVLNFSVAVSVGFGDNQKTLWVSCALWGERAEKLEAYLHKGKAVAVSGDVDIRTFDRRDGSAGAEITLNVQRLTLLGGRQDGDNERQGNAPPRSNKPVQHQREAEPAGKQEDFDDDIPF